MRIVSHMGCSQHGCMCIAALLPLTGWGYTNVLENSLGKTGNKIIRESESNWSSSHFKHTQYIPCTSILHCELEIWHILHTNYYNSGYHVQCTGPLLEYSTLCSFYSKFAGECIGDVIQCPSGECIPRLCICDGFTDCSDGWDEEEDSCKSRSIISNMLICE